MAASPFGMSANLRPSLGESSPGNLKYSGVMYPIAANMEILNRQWKVAAEVPRHQMHAAIPTHLTLSQPIRTSSSPITYHYCTILHSHSEPLVHTLPAWQSPRSKSKIIQHPTTACGFGSCHASAQPRVGAWRRPGHRLRRGQGGPRSPPEAAPWNQNKYINEWDKENSERDFIVNLFPNTGSSVFTCRWFKATYHRKFCEMQTEGRTPSSPSNAPQNTQRYTNKWKLRFGGHASNLFHFTPTLTNDVQTDS